MEWVKADFVNLQQLLPPFRITCHFGFSRYISFVMHPNTYLCLDTLHYVSRKAKTTSNLGRRSSKQACRSVFCFHSTPPLDDLHESGAVGPTEMIWLVEPSPCLTGHKFILVECSKSLLSELILGGQQLSFELATQIINCALECAGMNEPSAFMKVVCIYSNDPVFSFPECRWQQEDEAHRLKAHSYW
jgi:hypothetical protein